MIKGKLLILLFVILVGCTSTNKKMETHPTNNKNAISTTKLVLLNDTNGPEAASTGVANKTISDVKILRIKSTFQPCSHCHFNFFCISSFW